MLTTRHPTIGMIRAWAVIATLGVVVMAISRTSLINYVGISLVAVGGGSAIGGWIRTHRTASN